MTLDKATFSAGIAMLCANFRTELDPATMTVWYRALSSLTPAEFEATIQIVMTRERFWPTLAGVLAAAPRRSLVPRGTSSADPDTVLYTIQRLGFYTPSRGWIWPTPTQVRAALGDAVADAYADAGPGVSSTDEIARTTAVRAFTRSLAVNGGADPVRLALAAPTGHVLLIAPGLAERFTLQDRPEIRSE